MIYSFSGGNVMSLGHRRGNCLDLLGSKTSHTWFRLLILNGGEILMPVSSEKKQEMPVQVPVVFHKAKDRDASLQTSNPNC